MNLILKDISKIAVGVTQFIFSTSSCQLLNLIKWSDRYVYDVLHMQESFLSFSSEDLNPFSTIHRDLIYYKLNIFHKPSINFKLHNSHVCSIFKWSDKQSAQSLLLLITLKFG